MRTYQDLLNVGVDEQSKMVFTLLVINEHKSSEAYRTAVDALAYYERENPTITKYEKVIYDLQGKAHRDMYTANHKISSSFFQFAVDQAVSYLLGNGVSFGNEDTLGQLGANFDKAIVDVVTDALWGGEAYGFWNLDHIEVFSRLEFAPLYNEETGALSAGVRFWQLAADKPLRATLYEPDGYTEYIRRSGEDVTVLAPKRDYKLNISTSGIGGSEILNGENYPSFPIVPLKMGRKSKSEIVGRRNTIDALDLVDSGMVNNVSEGNVIYWAIKNAAGMDDIDLAEFIKRVHINHAVALGDGQEAEPHSVEAPVVATQAAHDMLLKKLYEDFQAFDASAITAGNQTATAIKASYVPLDLKTDRLEGFVTDFLLGILALAEIEDKPSYTRNQIINKTEETQAILLGAEYYDDEYITKKLLTINGDVDQYDELMKRKAAEDTERVEHGIGFLPGGRGIETDER